MSICEAEYIAGSQGMQELVLLKQVFSDICGCLQLKQHGKIQVSTVWEDNEATLTSMQAKLPCMTPQTKHIATKYHWFRSKFDDTIQAQKIDSKHQRVYIFTKSLWIQDFERVRSFLMGWLYMIHCSFS